MRFFYLIEKHNRIRLTAYRFRQLATFIVADISRRRSYQSRNRMTFLVFRHVDTHHIILVIEEKFRQSLSKFRLTHTRSSQEDKRTYWTACILKSCPATTYSVSHSHDCLILSHDALMQFLFKIEKFITLALKHLVHRNACPTRNDFSNIFCIYDFIDKRIITLNLFQFSFKIFYILLSIRDLTVTKFCYTTIVTLTFSILSFVTITFYIFLFLLNLFDKATFSLPTRFYLRTFVIQFIDDFRKLVDFLLIFLTFYSLAFYLKLTNLTFDILQFFRQRIDLQSQTRSSLID